MIDVDMRDNYTHYGKKASITWIKLTIIQEHITQKSKHRTHFDKHTYLH